MEEVPLLVISLFALALIYSILIFTSLFRFSKFPEFDSDFKIAKKFYVCLFIVEVVRMISFLSACLMYKLGISHEEMDAIRDALTGNTRNTKIEFIPKPLFLFMIAPEFLFIIAFVFLFWQLLSIYNQGHANLFRLMCSGQGKLLVLAVVVVLSTLQLTMLSLYCMSQVSANVFSIECCVLNFLAATFVCISQCVFVIIFSGSPYRSEAYKQKMKKMNIAIIIWCIARLLRGIEGAFEKKLFSWILVGLTYSKNSTLATPVVTIIVVVIVEVVPILIVLDWSFMEMFIARSDSIQSQPQNFSDLGSSLRSFDHQESQNKNPQQLTLQEMSFQELKSSVSQPKNKSSTKLPGSSSMDQLHLNTNQEEARVFADNMRETGSWGTIQQNQVQNYHQNKQIIINQNFQSFGAGVSPEKNFQRRISNEKDHNERETGIMVDKKDFKILEVFDQKYKGLGVLYRAELFGQIVMCREIRFTRVKEYVISDFIQEISTLQDLNLKHVLPCKGVNFDLRSLKLRIFMALETSLFAFLHQKKQHTLTPCIKKSIAVKIAKAMEAIHSHRISPAVQLSLDQEYYCHKHLSSYNIMVEYSREEEPLEEDVKIHIADLGSVQLKKYAKLFMEYQNTNGWSPPEVLADEASQSREVVQDEEMVSLFRGFKDQRSIDIYSFGVLLWELETLQVPFDGLPEGELRKLVAEKQLRPQIPLKTQSHLAQLIRQCWQKTAAKRPDFKYICECLQQVQFA